MSDRIFTIEEIREFGAATTAREQERAQRVGTEAGRDLIVRSRTVTARDGVLTIVDGDVLDAIRAIEQEAATAALDRVREAVEGLMPTYPYTGATVRQRTLVAVLAAIDARPAVNDGP